LGPWRDGLLGEDAADGGGALAGGGGEVGGQARRPLQLAEALLDRAIFERVKGDDDAAAAGPELIGKDLEEARQLAELVVDGDAQRLERARRGIDALVARRAAGHCPGDDGGELRRRVKLTGADCVLDGARESGGVALLAEVAEDDLQLIDVERLD